MTNNEQTPYENTDETVKTTGLINTARYVLGRWGVMGSAARYLLMKSETNRFMDSDVGLSKKQRRKLVQDFSKIHANIQCAHSPYQFVLIAKYLLELDVEGPIVECGCFKGGGTAKLSLLAKMTNRELIVCDSFEGLPTPKNTEEARLEGHGDHPGFVFAGGEYTGTLDEVKENVRKWGEIDVCRFVPGFYETSLEGLDIKPACVFLDVDLVSSARDCLQHLWPGTQQNGLWFTHEASLPVYVQGLLDPDWWQENLDQSPPIIYGGGSGLSEASNSLAYFIKTGKVST